MNLTIRCEEIATHPDYRRLHDIPGIAVDLRYASADNFVGRDLYSPLDCAYLHREAAEGLAAAAAWLEKEGTGARILVLDAMRPQRVQQQLWDALAGTDLRSYLAHPERGSIHSFGMAADVTLTDSQGREFDMGTPFDDMTERSHPVLEEIHMVRGILSQAQVENRRLLRNAMLRGGFQGINSEWWHFDCGDRDRVRAAFRRIL